MPSEALTSPAIREPLNPTAVSESLSARESQLKSLQNLAFSPPPPLVESGSPCELVADTCRGDPLDGRGPSPSQSDAVPGMRKLMGQPCESLIVTSSRQNTLRFDLLDPSPVIPVDPDVQFTRSPDAWSLEVPQGIERKPGVA